MGQPVLPAGMTVSLVCALLTARWTPELERVQAELDACTSFRDGARILEALLPTSPAKHESVRNRAHAVALHLKADNPQAATEGMAVRNMPDQAVYAGNNESALIDYDRRYRADKPILTSRAEGTLNQRVNARVNERRQMRWSPERAHRVLQVRAAVLD